MKETDKFRSLLSFLCKMALRLMIFTVLLIYRLQVKRSKTGTTA